MTAPNLVSPRSQELCLADIRPHRRDRNLAGHQPATTAFNAAYRNHIDSFTETLPPELASPVWDSPATALAAAQQAGPNAQAIIDAAPDAFSAGMQGCRSP